MRYTFMNKNKEILDCEIIQMPTGQYEITKVYELKDIAYRPIHLSVKNGIIDRTSLNSWFYDRKIPASRQNIEEILEHYDIKRTDDLILKYFGLSLSDQYWFKPKELDLRWSEINFFENDFSDDIGNGLFNFNDLSLKSPDNTSDGWLKKTWKIVDGERVLFKSGSGLYKQEVFNERVAYEISKLMGFEHIPYIVTENDGEYHSACKNFINENTELISAYYVMNIDKKPNHISDFDWFIMSCEKLGIENAREKLSDILVLDYIIANTDRHYGNFGIIRNVENINEFKFAPIFDSGTSMGMNLSINKLLSNSFESRPFYKDSVKQVKLVNLEKYDFSKLKYVEDLVVDIYSENQNMEIENSDRKFYLARSVSNRIKELQQLKQQRKTIEEREEELEL